MMGSGSAISYEHDYDVLVAGAGVAGVAAALEAARAGLRTAIIEKTIIPGGLATNGLILFYAPLCDGNGRQIMFGMTEEFFRLSIRYGPGDEPEGWGRSQNAAPRKRYSTLFSPASFVLALDEVLVEAGVDLWFDTLICLPVMTGNRVTGVEVENKNGRGVLRAACVVDATGDADVVYRAGAPCAEAGNWLSLWILQCSLERAQKAAREGSGSALLAPRTFGGDAAGAGQPADARRYHGTDAREITDFVLHSRGLLRDACKAAIREKGDAARRDVFPVALPGMAQFRTVRRIAGAETLSAGQAGRCVDSSIGLVGDWQKPGAIWEIPYGALLPEKVEGVVTAGRCISAEGEAWEVTRVIPPVVLTGQVAGLAATMAVRQRTTPSRLDVGDIQASLRQKGILIHDKDL